MLKVPHSRAPCRKLRAVRTVDIERAQVHLAVRTRLGYNARRCTQWCYLCAASLTKLGQYRGKYKASKRRQN